MDPLLPFLLTQQTEMEIRMRALEQRILILEAKPIVWTRPPPPRSFWRDLFRKGAADV